MESIDAQIKALWTDRSLRKPLRDRLRWVHLPEAPSTLDLVSALCTLREVMQGERTRHPAVDVIASQLASMARASGFDPGSSVEEADRVALRLRTGCWVVEGPMPSGAIVVLGGLPWDKILAEIQAKHDEVLRVGRGGLFVRLGIPTAWMYYLERLKPEERARMPGVKAACEQERLVGAAAPEASWNNDHYFAFSDGVALGLSWRAWGDLQVAITGEGHYLDYY